MTLKKYKEKRTFSKTPEPSGVKRKSGTVRSHLRATAWRQQKRKTKQLVFVVQEHHASHLHWDFRLEMEGVLKSWAIPKGPSMDPSIKHLAVHVEDHPYAYRKFKGTIPEGNYGAGTVSIWDEGTYEPVEQTDDPEKILLAELKKGDLKFIMHGKKLKGEFALVELHGDASEEGKNWLLIKKHDAFISSDTVSKTQPKKSPTPIKSGPMLHSITPMLAKLSDKPFSKEGWIYEMKWDGYRAVAEIKSRLNRDKGGKVHLYSRNHKDFTVDYPDVVKSLSVISHDAVLDGEIIAVDATGSAKFQNLQSYSKRPQGITLIYEVFDLLYLDGYDLRVYPLIERKKLLKKLLPRRAHIAYSEHVEGQGDRLFSLAKKKEMEGIMAKKKDSQYVSIRSDNWLKIKNIQMQEALICGYTEPRGTREEFGALILGIYDNGELRYVGHTGSGFDRKKLQDIIALLKPLEQIASPFAHTPKTNMPATWVKPKLIAQIKFSEWTQDGMMRQPIFLGIRSDKKPTEVTQESLLAVTPDEKKFQKQVLVQSGKAQLSNQDKIFWPQEGYTKGDVVSYYEKVAPYILPYLKDRAESLNRHPNGIEGESFYHKDLLNKPKWVRTQRLYSSVDKKYIHWLVCNDKDTLLYMANLGCIEINPWSSRITKKDFPDYLIIDLDPNGAPFTEVVHTALEVKKLMDKAKMESFIKTSGKTGLHILVPLGAKYTFDQTRKFAQILATTVSSTLPNTTSVVRDPSKRQKKVYIDYLQNRVGQTIAAPYSIRPVPGAQVSTPLQWNELTNDLLPSDFTIKNIFRRLGKVGDIWEPFRKHKGIDILKSLERLSQQAKKS